MNKILYLPLDERPCNETFPKKLIKIADDIELISPPKDILGKKKIPGNFEEISKFLISNAGCASYAVISLDQLLYGGIIPSRIHHLKTDELIERLSLLKELKKINPLLKIFAFVLIMRCPKYSSSDEEPDYYEICGEEIFKYGTYLHKAEEVPKEISEKVAPYLDDYLTRRQINKQMILEILKETKDSIDYLVIPQDDSSPYGFTTMEKLEIFETIKKENYSVLIYPGADEVGLSLMARAVSKIKNYQVKFYLNYLCEEAKNLIPAYENKPLDETVKNQIEVTNSKIVTNIDDADIILALNYNKEKEEESSNFKEVNLPIDLFNQQIDFICNALKDNKKVSLVDKFFVNGGCVDYLEMLFEKVNPFDLSGYASWNTSSNSLGTVISESILNYFYDNQDAKNEFIAERIYDDAAYQSRIRKEITDNVLPKYHYNYFDIQEVRGVISSIIKDKLTEFVGKHYPVILKEYQIKRVANPWKRMFEIDLDVTK